MRSPAITCACLLGCGSLTSDSFDTSGAFEVGAELFDTYCAELPSPECGHVYMFEAAEDNELGHVELCILDSAREEHLALAEMLWGESRPTPRHPGPCIHCCPNTIENCGVYSSAINGSFCP